MTDAGIRIHVRVPQNAVDAIDELAVDYYEGNRSAAVSDAIIAFATRAPIIMRKERNRLAKAVAEFIRHGGDLDADA